MKNKQNCRIGWITPEFSKTMYRFTLKGDYLIVESQNKYVGVIVQSSYKLGNDRTIISNMYRRFPYHPLLRTLITMPQPIQVLAWGNPEIYNKN